MINLLADHVAKFDIALQLPVATTNQSAMGRFENEDNEHSAIPIDQNVFCQGHLLLVNFQVTDHVKFHSLIYGFNISPVEFNPLRPIDYWCELLTGPVEPST